MSNNDDVVNGKVPQGAVNVAAVLLALGPDVASPLIDGLEEEQMRLIARGAAVLRNGPGGVLNEALVTFVNAMRGEESELAGADTMLQNLLASQMGSEVAKKIFAENFVPSLEPDDRAILRAMEPQSLALLLSREGMQTRALVMSVLEPEQATAVLSFMPEEERAQLLSRMGRLESVSPEVMDELISALASEAKSVATRKRLTVAGQDQAVEMLKKLDGNSRNDAMAELEREDPELAVKVRSKLFEFADLINLSDRDIQQMLKEVDTKNLVVALKGAAEDVKEKLLANVSERVRLMILDDLEVMAPVRLAVVEQAQSDLVKVVLSLAEEGQITIPDATEQMV
jgi:flagellar motor switch protein FliG